jgi:endogenous inhibitor of DNA gyrase (YacG/DUF329 family)
MPTCPICEKPSPLRAQNAAFPFCSPRCKQVDLGQWLDERYRVATPERPPSDDDTGMPGRVEPPDDR